MVYLEYRLRRAGVDGPRRIGVIPAIDGWLRDELCAELRSAVPQAVVEVAAGGARAGSYDLMVVPFLHGLHRNFLGDKTRLLLRALRLRARALLVVDVMRRRVDVVRRTGIPGWYVRRLGEYAVVRAGRALGWRRS